MNNMESSIGDKCCGGGPLFADDMVFYVLQQDQTKRKEREVHRHLVNSGLYWY